MHDFHPNDIGHHHDHCCDNEHKAADCCDDQLPLFSTLGRGIKGDGFKVRIAYDDCDETYLEGLSYDEASKTWTSEWTSENINGGELSYQYNLRPFTDPQTFTITFIYRRPNRHPDRTHTGIDRPANKDKTVCEWSWTSPAIPYIWSIGDDGNKADPDGIVGSGVATIFVRASKNEAWNVSKHERLHYPKGTTRDDYNAPLPEKAWSATVTFGYGGDVELPNFDDLAKIIGCSKEDIFNILQDNSVHWDGIDADNLLDYINKCDKRDLDHIHKDLGFNNSNHGSTGAFGGEDTVKKYIDKMIEDALKHMHKDLGFESSGASGDNHGYNNEFGGEGDVKKYIDKKIANINIHIKNLYGLVYDIVGHIYGASLSTVDSGDASNRPIPDDDKGWKINWNPDAKIPQGNLNVYGGDSRGKWIKTHANEENDDVWAR